MSSPCSAPLGEEPLNYTKMYTEKRPNFNISKRCSEITVWCNWAPLRPISRLLKKSVYCLHGSTCIINGVPTHVICSLYMSGVVTNCCREFMGE